MTRRGPPGHLTRPSRGAFFPAASGKLLLSLPAAQVPTRIGPPRQQANAAESADTAAESADTAPRAATAPVSKPAVFLIEPWTIQSVLTHRQHLLPILPTLPIFSALPIPTLRPPCLNQRCFVSVSPRRIFLPGLDSPPSSPCSSKNLRCRFPPTNLQLHKSALPIPPPVAWLPPPQCPDQQSSPSSLGLSSPEIPGTLPDRVAASATPCPWRGSGGTNRSDMGLNLSGSWQQGHSATYNTPSRI